MVWMTHTILHISAVWRDVDCQHFSRVTGLDSSGCYQQVAERQRPWSHPGALKVCLGIRNTKSKTIPLSIIVELLNRPSEFLQLLFHYNVFFSFDFLTSADIMR